MEKVGGARQYLVIDLASEQWDVRLIPEPVYARFPGGEALALHLWSRFAEDDYHEAPFDAPLIFTLGALAGSAAMCTSILTITGLSPQTHMVSSSTAIASFVSSLVSCGWQAVVLHGVARRQMTLHIDATSVRFNPSERLLQKRTAQTVRLLSERGESDSVLCIGPAGEQGVSFASIMHEGRALERSGFGAVMGKKHIKALIVSEGPYAYRAKNERQFSEAYKTIGLIVGSSSHVKRYQQAGPLLLLEHAQNRGFAAVENFTKRTDPRLFHLGSSECARKFALETISCNQCLLCCQRNVMRPGGKDTILPDAWEMLALGSNIGNYDPSIVMQLREECIDLGLHPVSTGVLLGCVMDAKRHNLLDDTISLQFGETAKIVDFIELIAEQSSGGKLFGRGVQHLLQSLQHERTTDIDCQIGGREMAPFDPRGAWGEALMIGLHEDVPFVPELLCDWLPTTSLNAKAEWVILQENYLAIMRSIGLCDELIIPLFFDGGGKARTTLLKLFSRFPSKAQGLIDLAPLAELFSGFTGISISPKQLLAVGRRTVQMRRKLQGEEALPARLPLRFLLDPESNCAEGATVPYTKLVARYRFLRALDLAALEEG